MTTALITGASGFIGRSLVRSLIAKNTRVRCLVRSTSNTAQLQDAELCTGDITEPTTLRQAVRGVDVVYHLASLLKMPWKRAFMRVNRDGTANLARACAQADGPPTLVVVSSLAAGGPSKGRPRSESDGAEPVSIYGRVKLSAERAAVAVAGEAPVSIVRPPLVFGPSDIGALKLFQGAAKGWQLQVAGASEQRVSLIHVDDLAEGLALVGERGERVGDVVGSGVYYLADDARPTVPDLGRALADACDNASRLRTLAIPRPIFWCVAAASEAFGRIRDAPAVLNLDKYREVTAGSWICSVDKAHQQLGFRTADLTARLRETADWYRANGLL